MENVKQYLRRDIIEIHDGVPVRHVVELVDFEINLDDRDTSGRFPFDGNSGNLA